VTVPDIDHRLDAPIVTVAATDRVRDLLATQPDADLLAAMLGVDVVRIGSLFSGYGGLDRAVMDTLGGTVAWHVEHDKHPSAILAAHYPDVPNYGDVTAVDWAAVEPVDVLTGGFPCQDLSTAGKRRGLRPGTRSGLWEQMAYAIDQLRPSLVVIENVRGLLSAYAHSDVESCPICLGDGPDGALRALGAVVGDLAGLGYGCRWGGVRASDAGAPHGRFRVFLVAYPDREHGDWRGDRGPGRWTEPTDGRATPADADGGQRDRDEQGQGRGPERGTTATGRGAGAAADADEPGPQGPQPTQRHHLPAGAPSAPTPPPSDAGNTC
jgi:DNA (cytosine-5)-methyltransferase 1